MPEHATDYTELQRQQTFKMVRYILPYFFRGGETEPQIFQTGEDEALAWKFLTAKDVIWDLSELIENKIPHKINYFSKFIIDSDGVPRVPPLPCLKTNEIRCLMGRDDDPVDWLYNYMKGVYADFHSTAL